ncbi:MAG TPA: hypothetical protein VFG12_04445 [Rhodopila sp.]|nr:hypothetical protein [Rhodopila sp.]
MPTATIILRLSTSLGLSACGQTPGTQAVTGGLMDAGAVTH